MSPETHSAFKQHKSEVYWSPHQNRSSCVSVGSTPAAEGKNFTRDNDTALVHRKLLSAASLTLSTN